MHTDVSQDPILQEGLGGEGQQNPEGPGKEQGVQGVQGGVPFSLFLKEPSSSVKPGLSSSPDCVASPCGPATSRSIFTQETGLTWLPMTPFQHTASGTFLRPSTHSSVQSNHRHPFLILAMCRPLTDDHSPLLCLKAGDLQSRRRPSWRLWRLPLPTKPQQEALYLLEAVPFFSSAPEVLSQGIQELAQLLRAHSHLLPDQLQVL